MILSKIADSRPESMRWPSASIVSLAAMPPFYLGTIPAPVGSEMPNRRSEDQEALSQEETPDLFSVKA
jgi:hypothetical protein